MPARPNPDKGNRSESIGRFLAFTEYPTELTERVVGRQRQAENKGNSIDSIQALGYLFLEQGSQYIKDAYEEMPKGTGHLHPYRNGGFSKLDDDDKRLVTQSYTGVILGASVLVLTDMMESGKGTFDRNYFLALYNFHMMGSAFPTVVLADTPIEKGQFANEDGEEIIGSDAWQKLEQQYNQRGFVDFFTDDMYGFLPPSLRQFIHQQGADLPGLIKTLGNDFAARAGNLVEQERTARRSAMSMFYDAQWNLALDPTTEPIEPESSEENN